MRYLKIIFVYLYLELKEKLIIFFWPNSQLKKDGIETIKNFLTEEECDYFINLADQYKEDKSYMIGENAWFVNRSEKYDNQDSKVSQLMNVQNLDEKAEKLFFSKKIEKLFHDRIKEDLFIRSISIQIDKPDTSTKRSWHVDNTAPASYKAFIYLTDVLNNNNGAYTVIKGTHKKNIRRWLNTVLNFIKNKPLTDVNHFIKSNELGDEFKAKKGTLIMSNQTLFHRGSPFHSEKTRYMMVIYLRRSSDQDAEFTLGKPS